MLVLASGVQWNEWRKKNWTPEQGSKRDMADREIAVDLLRGDRRAAIALELRKKSHSQPSDDKRSSGVSSGGFGIGGRKTGPPPTRPSGNSANSHSGRRSGRRTGAQREDQARASTAAEESPSASGGGGSSILPNWVTSHEVRFLPPHPS